MIHPDRRQELYEQLKRETYEGMAADRLEAERRRNLLWDIEGWDGDTLRVYITGCGLLEVPADEVWRFGSALLAEHQLRYSEDEWADGAECDLCGERDVIGCIGGTHYYCASHEIEVSEMYVDDQMGS